MAIVKRQQGLQNQGSSTVSTISNTTYNPTKQPGTSEGNFEIKRFLYDSGLQNIFNDFQANIATLDKQEQQNLQEAYYIREMSKKYLGEYASNMGIGDVSGNLLDIYGKYQENVGAIRENYNNLELGLQSDYQAAQRQAFDAVLQAQYQRGVEELDENSQGLIFNITSGNIPEGLDQWEYLSSEFAAGRITEQDYQTIYGTLYSQGMAVVTRTVQTGIQTGVFGTNDDGEKIENIYDYVAYAQDKYKLTDADAKLLLDQVAAGTQVLEEGGYEIKFYNVQMAGQDNADYLEGLDPENYSPEADKDSLVFSIDGIDYVSVAKNVDDEELGALDVSSVDLNQLYYKTNPNGFAGVGTVVFNKETNSFYVVGKDNKWHRALNTPGVASFQSGLSDTQTGGSTWFIAGDNVPTSQDASSANGVLQTNGNDPDTFTYAGKTYEGVVNSKSVQFSGANDADLADLKVKDLDNNPVDVSDILAQAVTQFGKADLAALLSATGNFVVFYNGNFWNVYKKNNSNNYSIRPMKLKE
jgi:hypothetical protein